MIRVVRNAERLRTFAEERCGAEGRPAAFPQTPGLPGPSADKGLPSGPGSSAAHWRLEQLPDVSRPVCLSTHPSACALALMCAERALGNAFSAHVVWKTVAGCLEEEMGK